MKNDMKQFNLINYKDFELIIESINSQVICKAYKHGKLIKKQRFFFYTENEALQQFKQYI